MAKITGDLSKAGMMAPDDGGRTAAGRGRRDRLDRAAVPGGWVMARPATRPRCCRRRRAWCGALVILAAAVIARRRPAGVSPALAQDARRFRRGRSPTGRARRARAGADARARRRRSITTTATSACRRSATCSSTIGNSTLEADRVIYDQKTKRLHARRQCRADPGRRHGHPRRDHGSERRLSRRFRRFAADSTRRRQTRFAAARAERSSGNFTVFHNGVYTACEAVQGRSEEAAEMAGEGGADHPRSRREDAVFRGRAARVSRRAARLFSVLLGARSDREAQDRRAGADLQHELGLRRSGSRSLTTGRWRPITTRPSRR